MEGGGGILYLQDGIQIGIVDIKQIGGFVFEMESFL